MNIELLEKSIDALELAKKFQKMGGMDMLDINKPCKHTDNYNRLVEFCKYDNRILEQVKNEVFAFDGLAPNRECL